MRSTPFLIAICCPIPCALAAQQPPSLIVTDRPDVAESGLVVGRGVYQVEAGADLASNESRSAFAAPLKLRAGVSEALELHLESGTFQWNEGAGGSVTDVDLGGKWAIWGAEAGYAVALLSALTIPLDTDEGYRARPTLIAEGPLSDWVSLGVNLGATIALSERDVSEDFGRFAASLGWASPDWERLGLFTEAFGEFDEESVRIFANGGGTYKVTPSVQLDAYARVGVRRAFDEFGGGLGLSFRVE